jgi:hypothetical protein
MFQKEDEKEERKKKEKRRKRLAKQSDCYLARGALFDLAFKTYKRIDHVVSAASIVEIGNWFDTSLTLGGNLPGGRSPA